MPVSFEELNQKLDTIGGNFETFKKANDQRLAEIEKHGKADPLTEGKVAALNESLDAVKAQLAQLQRPDLGGDNAASVEEKEYKTAFRDYARKGNTAKLEEFASKAMSVDSDPDGGYLVPRSLSASIAKYVTEVSPMRQLATVETISSDGLDIVVDADAAAAGWVGEQTSRTDTTTPQFKKKSIVAHELYAQPKATQKLIEDAAVDVEAWLAGKVGEVFAVKEGTAFISGNGVGQPKGILDYAHGTSFGTIEQINSGTSATITADGLIKLFYGLKAEYAQNASYLMNRASVQAVRLLKDSTNQYIWAPGLALGSPDTLLGRPVFQATDMPVAAANSLSVAIADFKRAYTIVDRVGITILRDPFTDKPFVKFYTKKRVGGDVVNFEAIKLLKLAA